MEPEEPTTEQAQPQATATENPPPKKEPVRPTAEGLCPICHLLSNKGEPFTTRGFNLHLRQKHPEVMGDEEEPQGTVLRIGVGDAPRPPAPEPAPAPSPPAADFLPITAEQVANILRSQAIVTNQLLAPGTTAWFWTEDELDLIAPAAARMANRSKAAAAIANASDPIAVLTAGSAYVVRNVQNGGIRGRVPRAPGPPRQHHQPAPGGPGDAGAGEGAATNPQPPGEPPGEPGGNPGIVASLPRVGPSTGLWPA